MTPALGPLDPVSTGHERARDAAESVAVSALTTMLGTTVPVQAGDLLDDLGADSITLIGWADHVEDQVARTLGLSISVPDELLANARTVRDLMDGLTDVLARRIAAVLATP